MPTAKLKKGKPDPLDEARFTLLLKEVQAARREIAALHKQGKTIMTTFSEQLAQLQKSVDAAEQRADDRDAALTKKLADLQAAFDALVAGGGVTPEQQAALQAAIDDLDAFAVTPPIVGGGETPVP